MTRWRSPFSKVAICDLKIGARRRHTVLAAGGKIALGDPNRTRPRNDGAPHLCGLRGSRCRNLKSQIVISSSAGRLNQQVRRNIGRFPSDFMFSLDPEEAANLKSQFAVSSWGGRHSTLPVPSVARYHLHSFQGKADG